MEVNQVVHNYDNNRQTPFDRMLHEGPFRDFSILYMDCSLKCTIWNPVLQPLQVVDRYFMSMLIYSIRTIQSYLPIYRADE